MQLGERPRRLRAQTHPQGYAVRGLRKGTPLEPCLLPVVNS